MNNVFGWPIEGETKALAALIDERTDLPTLPERLGLCPPRPVIVLVGGAKGLGFSEHEGILRLLTDVLVPLAESLGAAIIDGGTNSGVMGLIGQMRGSMGAEFPLIGVLPAGKVALPGLPPPVKDAQLESHHTHFIFVPGAHWGDESAWLAQFASVLAQGAPSFTLVVNGGDVAWRDAAESVRSGRPVGVVGGSGRAADSMADALHGRSTNAQARDLAASGLLREIKLTSNVKDLTRTLREILVPEAV